MLVLALDTTTRSGSVALVQDDRIVIEEPGDPMRSHAERLPGDIIALLEAAKVPLSTIDLFAVASGPGSFTGLRIGIATIQGLSFVSGRPVVPVSALEALAQTAARDLEPGASVAAWMDAYRREVFSARYRVTDATPFDPARLVEIDSPMVADPVSLLSSWTSDGTVPEVFIGDGAVEYAHHIPETSRVLEHPMLAGAIGLIALRNEAATPAAVQPLYVRRPDAETDRDRRQAPKGEHA